MPVELERRMRFEAMFDRHHAAVRSYVLRRSAGIVVEDVVADTFLVAWRRLEDVPEPALPWLLGVVLHRARGRVAVQLGIDQNTPSITERLA
jgi:DNA-directed RNA polymerase specialized sigma24 family protein